MSLPHLLLVDDSEAILAYEKAALGDHYLLSTASNGREALQKIRSLKPAAVLLDLSMPEMSGDEVLRQLQHDPEHAGLPVVVVSSEKERAHACLQLGAHAYLVKPVQAQQLRDTVGRVLEAAQARGRQNSRTVLFLSVGNLEVGLPLEAVAQVLLRPSTRPLAGSAGHLSRYFEWHGQSVVVLDLARPLRVAHLTGLGERKVVVVRAEGVLLGLEVDEVREPEEFTADRLLDPGALAEGGGTLLGRALDSVVRSERGLTPVLNPTGLLSRAVLRRLRELLGQARQEAGSDA